MVVVVVVLVEMYWGKWDLALAEPFYLWSMPLEGAAMVKKTVALSVPSTVWCSVSHPLPFLAFSTVHCCHHLLLKTLLFRDQLQQ